MASDWGTITVGRIALREVFSVSETGGDGRKLSVAGQEASPDLTRVELVARHDNLLALEGTVVPVTFTDKPERNGYYTVESVTADLTEWRGDVVKSDWALSLNRLGAQSETDLQSRLTGATRVNQYSLMGERWHAPPIGHYGYYTGSSNPSSMTRTGEDGAITVYRGVPATFSPRWGCDPTDYMQGRVRFLSAGIELTGCDHECSTTDWQLSNGLVNVVPSASASLDVQAYTGGGWRSKLWQVFSGASTTVTSWDAVNVLHNEPEAVSVRFTKSLSPGRLYLDLTLRRGSRFVEGYLRRGTADTLQVRLATMENNTAPASGEYVTASANDAAGNRFIVGSASNFTPHASGGLSLAATTGLDFFLGVVAGGGTAAAGDGATVLRDQYLATVPERIYAVRR
ncbi:hypothetical protein [Streptomyces griseoaurantiacus]|uniref:Uncharacterized protein n=1 Tax=Streptomyces griseoaurantiacus TaxID=68213 RepID=A0A7W2DSP4_9ACTN|nr:hypothetical protein [Streptomyces griseoaurantiacus]MBA5222216.1 hypothetical protein [Streptomyces griseoaurantiacus]